LEEVEQEIGKLKYGKSPRTDSLTAELLKSGQKLARQVHEICETRLVEGTKTILVTIPKNGDFMQCEKSRTIAWSMLAEQQKTWD